jgi:hypothetical protein
MLGRSRTPPGVLPVLSSLAPHRLPVALAAPAPAKAPTPSESKPAPPDSAAAEPPAAPPTPVPAKNVFQRAKEMKM